MPWRAHTALRGRVAVYCDQLAAQQGKRHFIHSFSNKSKARFPPLVQLAPLTLPDKGNSFVLFCWPLPPIAAVFYLMKQENLTGVGRFFEIDGHFSLAAGDVVTVITSRGSRIEDQGGRALLTTQETTR